jgi:hypothetical protein
LRFRVLRVRLQNANAFGARARVIRQHGAQRDGKRGRSGVTIGHRAHAGHCGGFSSVGSVERLIVGHAHIAVGGMVAIELAVDADGLVGFALARQFPGLAQFAAFALGARHGRDFGNVGVAGMLAAQTAKRLVGLVCRSHEFVVPRKAGEGFSIIGFREQNLLPELNGHVGPSAGFKGTGFIHEGGSGRCGRTSRRLILGET